MTFSPSAVRSRLRRGLAAVGTALALALVTAVLPANALTFSRNGAGTIELPQGKVCPTLSQTPPAYDGWFNIDEMERRGFWDPKNQTAWDYSRKLSQIICGAAKNSEIRIGMYFIRALGTMSGNALGTRAESDPEVVYAALEWVKKNRNVAIGLIVEGSALMPADAKDQVAVRLRSIATVRYCTNGCLNTNASSVYPFAIDHEKFLTISDTVWANSARGPHPAILSMSGNFARSQLRNYHQEATLIYDDHKMWQQFDYRYDAMHSCATTGCPTSKGFPKGLALKRERKIWVDPIYRHYTDAGRGSTVSFAPATPQARDFYIQQFDDVDCTVDRNIRIAMFKLTDSKAEQMVQALTRLKSRGCDISMLLTSSAGQVSISPAVVKVLNRAKIPARCTTVAVHTKMILIGPARSNAGRALVGTQNMSVSGLRYNEEHVITFDTRTASAAYRESVRRLYGEYLNGWYELAQNTRACA